MNFPSWEKKNKEKKNKKKKKKKKNKASDSFPRLSAQEGKSLASPHPETNKAKMYREG